MSHLFPSPPLVFADLEASMAPDVLRETAYQEQLGLDRSLYRPYRALEQIVRELEVRAGRIRSLVQLQHLQEAIDAIETNYKHAGLWSSKHNTDRTDENNWATAAVPANIPAGQARINDMLERAHALVREMIRYLPNELPIARSATAIDPAIANGTVQQKPSIGDVGLDGDSDKGDEYEQRALEEVEGRISPPAAH